MPKGVYNRTAEHRRINSIGQKKRFEDPAERAKQSVRNSIGTNKRYEDPGEREKQSVRISFKHVANGHVGWRQWLMSDDEYIMYGKLRTMHYRCYNKSCKAYSGYGGRGIRVCERWSFTPEGLKNFIADMGFCPDGMSLDRYPDPYGNYCPENCRWATSSEQRRNQRKREVK